MAETYAGGYPSQRESERIMSEICLFCSSDKDENGLVICSNCNENESGEVSACGACGEWEINPYTGKLHDCSEEVQA